MLIHSKGTNSWGLVSVSCVSTDLLTTEYDGQVLGAIITVAMSVIPCTCNAASAMLYLQGNTCDGI